MLTRFETPAAHRLGDGLMGVLWQMILPVSLLLVFGLVGGGLARLELPGPALGVSLVFVGLGLLTLWVRVASKRHRASASAVALAEHALWLGSAEVSYPQVRTLALTPTNPESPGGDLSLLVGVGDSFRETRVVLSHRDGLAAFDALRARCLGAVATDLEGVDHEPDDPEHRAAARRVLGRRREKQSLKHMIIGALVLAWGGLLVGLVLFNDSKPISDKLEALLTGLALLAAGGGWLVSARVTWKRAKANLAEGD